MTLTAEYKYAALKRWMAKESRVCRALAGPNGGRDKPHLLGRSVALRDALKKASLLDKNQRVWK